MAVKIKLQRLGKIHTPHYRIIVADARTRRDGRAIETIGQYHPKSQPSFIEVNSERVQYWLGVGAQPTEPVQGIFEATGDWQKFKGLPGAEGTLKTPEPKPSKQELFNAALAAANEEPSVEATTPKKKGGKKSEEKSGTKAERSEAGGEAESQAEQPTDSGSETAGGETEQKADQT